LGGCGVVLRQRVAAGGGLVRGGCGGRWVVAGLVGLWSCACVCVVVTWLRRSCACRSVLCAGVLRVWVVRVAAYACACVVVAWLCRSCVFSSVLCTGIFRVCVCSSVLCTGINRVCRVLRLRAARGRFGLLAFGRRERLEILLSSPRPFGRGVERPPSSPSPPTPVGEGSQRHDPPELFGQVASAPRLAHHEKDSRRP